MEDPQASRPTEEFDTDDLSAARELLRRTTELLADCSAHAEAALESEEPRELIEALRLIASSARDMRLGRASGDQSPNDPSANGHHSNGDQ